MCETCDPLLDELKALTQETQVLREHVTDLEARVDTLESKNKTLETKNTELKTQLKAHQQTLTATQAKTDALSKRTQTNKTRIEELQARELEKGAHLSVDTVDTTTIELTDNRLERITKDDQAQYYRLPEHDDPLDASQNVALAHGDLLPIQQLAKLDNDMLRSTTSTLPSRLAAKLWKARTDETVGDNPWNPGGNTIREYLKASDLKHWIRRQDPGVSDSYAKKLVSRTIDALLDLTKNRVAIRKKTERKNGLSYTERRIILPVDAEIPGETPHRKSTPETAGVHG